MEYLWKYWVHRVEILQGWTIRTSHCYSLAEFYLSEMKNGLFVAPESNGLSCACAVWFPLLVTPTEWTTRAKNSSWWRKTLSVPFEWRGPGTHGVAMKMPQWTYHGSLKFVINVTIVQSFISMQEKSSEIFQFLWL